MKKFLKIFAILGVIAGIIGGVFACAKKSR